MSGSPKFAASKLLASSLKKLDSPRVSIEQKTDVQPTKFGGITKKAEYSDEKIKSMLENYNEVPKSEWFNLPVGTHIRYLKKDGKFQTGGFIRSKNAKDDHQYFMLENDMFGNKQKNPNYTHWVMHFQNVAKVFAKKSDAPPSKILTNPTISNGMAMPPFNLMPIVENGYLQKQIDDLEKKYSNLESLYKNMQSKTADLEILVREISKYVRKDR